MRRRGEDGLWERWTLTGLCWLQGPRHGLALVAVMRLEEIYSMYCIKTR